MKPVTVSSFAGVRNTLEPERLHVLPTRDNPTTDLAAAVNVDIDNSGQIARRAGLTMKNAGAAHSLWARGDTALFVRGTSLNRLNANFSATPIATVTANLPVAYVAVNERIYWANGEETGVVERGLSRSWGIDIPAPPNLSTIGGTLAPGQYLSVVTHVREDGQESGAALPSVIQLVRDGGVRVTWGQPPADVAHVRVWLSTADGEIMYLATEVPASTTGVDVTSAASALPLNTQWQDKPPAGQALAYANGRIYIAQGANIFATTPLGYEYVDLRDFLALDGSRVRLLAGVDGGLFAATDQAAYFLRGKTFEDMEMTILATKGGVAGSVVYVDGERATGIKELAGKRCAMFATGDGVLLGMPDGNVINMTQERYRFAVGVAGAAIFHENLKLNSYLLFLQP